MEISSPEDDDEAASGSQFLIRGRTFERYSSMERQLTMINLIKGSLCCGIPVFAVSPVTVVPVYDCAPVKLRVSRRADSGVNVTDSFGIVRIGPWGDFQWRFSKGNIFEISLLTLGKRSKGSK